MLEAVPLRDYSRATKRGASFPHLKLLELLTRLQ
jgi:hypothetical protein